MHETGTEALMADGGEHTADTEDGIVGNEFVFVFIKGRFDFFAEEAGICNHFRTA